MSTGNNGKMIGVTSNRARLSNDLTNKLSETDQKGKTNDTEPAKLTTTGEDASNGKIRKKAGKHENKSHSEEFDTIFLKSLIARLIDANPKAEDEIVVSKGDIVYLCQLAVNSFKSQSTFLQLDESALPITVCADLHGQFLDLKTIFRECGYPPEKAWLFLGDYVDRGKYGVEVVCLLLALKIAYPNRCFLLRGNHEDYNTSMVYGFYDECLRKYGDADKHLVWLSFINVFNHLPLAALVCGRLLAMHGGISPYLNRLEDLAQIKRPTMVPLWGLACDVLWSDPGAARAGWSTSLRSVSFSYDETTVAKFCDQHNIDLIVRGHQIHESWSDRGYKMADNCLLVTIFSAPNYLGGGSTAAVLNISKELGCRFELFRPKKNKRAKAKSKKRE